MKRELVMTRRTSWPQAITFLSEAFYRQNRLDQYYIKNIYEDKNTVHIHENTKTRQFKINTKNALKSLAYWFGYRTQTRRFGHTHIVAIWTFTLRVKGKRDWLQSKRMNRHWWTDGQNRWNHTSPPLVSNTRTPNHPHHTTSTHGCIFTWALPKELVPSEGSKPSSFARGMTLIVPKSSHLCCLEIFQQIPIHSSVSLHVAVMVWFRKLALQISTCAPDVSTHSLNWPN